MAQQHKIRIFLASPKDTLPVREVVAGVIDEINQDPMQAQRVQIDLLRWDDPKHPVPCSFLRNPQNDVSTFTGDPGDCDLVIGLFRHSFGSRLPKADFGLSPDGDAWTGTEWELHRAVQAAQAGTVREVMVFRDLSPLMIEANLPDGQARASFEQSQRVRRFFDDCRDPATLAIVRGINEHDGPDDFEPKFKPRLKAWLAKELQRRETSASTALAPAAAAPASQLEPLTAQQQALQAILLAHDQALDGGLLSAAHAAPVAGLRGYLLQRFGAWCRPGQARLDRHFVTLHLLVDHGAGSDGERWGTRQTHADLAGMLAAQPEVGAWVLVGDPGGGKSTLLQHHEWVTARSALRALDDPAQRPELCIWQRLADCPHEAQPQAWLDQRWQVLYPNLPPLAALSRRFKLRYLLDGVNEIQAPDAGAYRAAVRRWADWAAGLAADLAAGLAQAGGAAAPIFSVRTLDYSEPLSSPTLQVQQARLARWTPAQMAQYCTLRLGPANALWPQIKGDPKLTELCALPFNLQAQCDLTQALGRPAQDRAELFGGLAWLRLRRALQRRELDGDGLLGDDDRRQLVDEHYWRDHLSDLPEQGSLLPGLARQAEAMHRSSQGSAVSLPRAAVAPWLAQPAQRAAWLQAALALQLAEVELSGRFRFSHQLWQEYLAARHLRHAALDPQAQASLPDLRPPPLEPLATLLGRLAAKDPLPGPGVNGWEEAIKLAVLMSEQPGRWLALLTPLNPALAGRAAAACLARLAGSADDRASLHALRQTLLARSQDLALDLRLRIEAAEALAGIGDPRYTRLVGPNGDAYLLPADAHWVTIPGGDYRIGSETGDADEQPITTVPLHSFQLAFAPVTNAEFRCFVEAKVKGYENERWWPGALASQWRAQGLRNQERIDHWTPRMAALREDFDRAVQTYFKHESEAYRERELRKYAGWTEADATANLEHSFGGRVCTEPNSWFDAAFNQPAQPVVGVCLFEAQAYCLWLSAQRPGWCCRLPTEAEWEAAARGDPARPWPWPEAVGPDPWQINAAPARLQRTSPIGSFPAGNTDQGLTDMAGNVWEWTSSLYTPALDATALTTAANDADASARRAVRGGSWLVPSALCRPGYRNFSAPGFRGGDLGFRVVCCPIHEP